MLYSFLSRFLIASIAFFVGFILMSFYLSSFKTIFAQDNRQISTFPSLFISFVASNKEINSIEFAILSEQQAPIFRKVSQFADVLTPKFRFVDRLVNKDRLKQELLAILDNEQDRYGIYLYDLKRRIEIEWNGDMILPPMSISKLPVGLMTLRAVDEGTLSLDEYHEFDGNSLAFPTNVLKREFLGVSFSVADYLRFLIVDSDNSSIRKLESLLGGYEQLNEKVKNELGIEHFYRDPHEATAKDVGKVFKGIYYQEYLSPDLNQYLIGLLQSTHSDLQDGIPVGVPEPYKYYIAHKTGQGSSDIGYIWEDAALVFGEKTDYIFVVLNDGIDFDTARYKVQLMSQVIWDELNT